MQINYCDKQTWWLINLIASEIFPTSKVEFTTKELNLKEYCIKSIYEYKDGGRVNLPSRDLILGPWRRTSKQPKPLMKPLGIKHL